MSEPIPPQPERRSTEDRRAPASTARWEKVRALLDGQLAWLKETARDLGIVVALVAAIAFTVEHVRPIYAGSAPMARQLTQAPPAPTPSAALTPADTSLDARIVRSPEFQRDRVAFAADLVRTGRMSQARADSVAYYAVREAYVRGIPPAVIFGVMLTENAVFASTATSNVGAVGLMQVYPKVWLKSLGSMFGRNLAVDSTNLKYGTYILSQYIRTKPGQSPSTAEVRSGLLKYNGCVRGTNTPNCHTYPNKVQNYVSKLAVALCGDKSFSDCITKPFERGLFGSAQ